MTDATQELSYDEDLPVDLDIPDTIPALTTTPIVEKPPANPTVITHFTSGSNWDFCPPTPELQLQVQELLANAGFYQGKLNGKWGNLSVFSIQAAVGRTAVRPDRELCVLIQDYAVELGEYDKNDLEAGYLSEDIWKAFIEGLMLSDTPK